MHSPVRLHHRELQRNPPRGYCTAIPLFPHHALGRRCDPTHSEGALAQATGIITEPVLVQKLLGRCAQQGRRRGAVRVPSPVAAAQALARVDARHRVGARGVLAQGLLLGKVDDRIGEIRAVDLGAAQVAAREDHPHEQGIAEVSLVEDLGAQGGIIDRGKRNVGLQNKREKYFKGA